MKSINLFQPTRGNTVKAAFQFGVKKVNFICNEYLTLSFSYQVKLCLHCSLIFQADLLIIILRKSHIDIQLPIALKNITCSLFSYFFVCINVVFIFLVYLFSNLTMICILYYHFHCSFISVNIQVLLFFQGGRSDHRKESRQEIGSRAWSHQQAYREAKTRWTVSLL